MTADALDQMSLLRLRVEPRTFPAGFSGDWHDHPEAQLVVPSEGVMRLEAGATEWLVPPGRGCWLPAGEPHRVRAPRGFRMLSVYCGKAPAEAGRRAGPVLVTPLLREVIAALETATRPARRRRLAAVFAEELRAPAAPPLLSIPALPARYAAIAEGLRDAPWDGRPLADWASRTGVSERALRRMFRRETGFTFTGFRNQVRLSAAAVRLAEGASVTEAALEAGFSSASNFIRAFRRATGLSPAAYRRSGGGAATP